MSRLYQVYHNPNNGKVGIRDKHTQKVVGYADRVYLTDCTFRVQRENVHAYVEGHISEVRGFDSKGGEELVITPEEAYTGIVHVERVYYNPCEHDIFYVLGDGDAKVDKTHADMVMVSHKGTITALNKLGDSV